MVRRGHFLASNMTGGWTVVALAVAAALIMTSPSLAQQAGFAGGGDSIGGLTPRAPITRTNPLSGTSAKGEQPAAPPPKWSATEVAAALKSCKQILKKYGAIAEPLSPLRHGGCGTPAPIRLIQLGRSAVRFDPPATVNCQMVAALAKWLDTSIQPQARKHLGSAIATISVMSSYSCRRAYGRRKARFSEHAFANALDIGGFVTRKGLDARLLAHWGPTQRELIAREQERERKAAAARPKNSPQQRVTREPEPPKTAAVPKPAKSVRTPEPSLPKPTSTAGAAPGPSPAPPAVVADAPPPVPSRRPSLKERLRGTQTEKVALRDDPDEAARLSAYRAKVQKFLYPMSKLGGPKPVQRVARSRIGTPKRSAIDQRAFLRNIHRDACGIFGTVLGPEANDAHRNHFHVDLATRRRRNYCR